MKATRLGLLLALIVPSLLWLQADPLQIDAGNFFSIRSTFVHFTGVLLMSVMSIAMLLALRPAFVESALGGLDKAYRLHKWLGISALALGIVHWLWAKGPKWAVGWGWIERPHRGPRPEQSVEIFRFFQEQRGLAETIGEWAFYLFVALAVIALAKRFPYRRFFRTHRLMAAVYLALVVHSVVLLPFAYWNSPLGIAMGALLVGGSYAAFASLLGGIGLGRRAWATVETLAEHPDSQVVEVGLKLTTPWPGHRAGQFAFVNFDPREGAHPYTIASAWEGDGRLRFMIKQLGDYTHTLPKTLRPGALVEVEGPYGRFTFGDDDGNEDRQIWVAGGIGLTPFLARLQALAHRPSTQPVDFFYSTDAANGPILAALHKLAARAGVRLYVTDSRNGQRIDAQGICDTVPDWKRGGVWFCGPLAFGQSLRKALVAKGLPEQRFHQELFDMR